MRQALLKFFGWSRLALFCFVLAYSHASAQCISGLSSHAQPPMQFEIQQGPCVLSISCKRWIYAYGAIEADSPARLQAVLDTLGDERILVALNSAGGDYRAAVEMGRMLRERVLPATVASSTLCLKGHACSPPALKAFDAECDFACVLVLLGSTTRTMPSDLKFYLPRVADTEYLPLDTIKTLLSEDKNTIIPLVDDYLTPKALDVDVKRAILGTGSGGQRFLYARQALSSRIITGFNSGSQSKQVSPPTVAPSVAVLSEQVSIIRIAGLAPANEPPMNFVLF